MAKPATLPVLDLNVLIAMYGDDSAETITLALSGFRREATHYVQQLQRGGQHDVLTDNALADTARLCHSLKSMCGLVGAAKLMQLCMTLEQAARQQDLIILQSELLNLAEVWPELLSQLNLTLLQHGYADE
ncbi:HPt (histidine-containing phosphotransfer) domain-containing protein [Rheinheimera pacifica]|uniref:Hpt domain-containing protein n=1 Tax=Rheinheimera pacifica TaxID=173990 RepID=UPI002678A6AE|nr:Hpt domain-containing protein [Rheinheimera pacifica]MDR6984107.1 HPt (histidine-containing phosphotransfer) domain-containing protein [Rheinheimera pacifica]